MLEDLVQIRSSIRQQFQLIDHVLLCQPQEMDSAFFLRPPFFRTFQNVFRVPIC